MTNFEIHIGPSAHDTTVKADGLDITRSLRGLVVKAKAGELTQLELVTASVGPSTAITMSGPFIQAPEREAVRPFLSELGRLLIAAPEDSTVTCEVESVLRDQVPTGEQIFTVRVRPDGVEAAATPDEIRAQRDELAAAMRWLLKSVNQWSRERREDMAGTAPYEACVQALSRVTDVAVPPREAA